jgi:hypothetical protein
MPSQRNDQQVEVIPLLRGGAVVSSLLGAFGTSLRETRLTATLGYIISLKPDIFNDLFKFDGNVLSVSLEANHEKDRSDILVETSKGNGVIEAKLDPTDPTTQAFKYAAKWRVLLTDYVPYEEQKKLRGVKYIQWSDIAKILRSHSRSSNRALMFACSDLLKCLEDNNMIRKQESVEIYAREINEEATLALFLKARMYGCQYQASGRLPEALYFAPHFGRSIADAHPGVKQGISYIARIESVQVAEGWKEFLVVATSVRGKTWLNSHMEYLEGIHRRWEWKDAGKRSFLFLGEPRLIFNPAIKKDNLQKGKGFLSKRTFSFDQLFAAWGK